MAYDDLRGWIKALEKAGELKRIHEPVDPILEIAEITDRVSKWGRPGSVGAGAKCAPGGPALLFENVKGHPGSRVLMNQFGSERRMKMALNVNSLDEVAARIEGLLQLKSPEGLLGKLKMLPLLAEVGGFFPRTVAAKDAPCKEVILRENFNVLDFPVLQCWPLDGGRFITLPCVITRDPKSGKRNVGMYRMQVYDGQTTGMHWQRQKVAAEHLRERLRAAAAAELRRCKRGAGKGDGRDGRRNYRLLYPRSVGQRQGQRLEVAVAIGTDPALTFSAIVPAPPEVEEFLIAGFLRQRRWNW